MRALKSVKAHRKASLASGVIAGMLRLHMYAPSLMLPFRCARPIAAIIAILLPSLCAADWPEFRGSQGNGHASPPGVERPIGLPLQWSEDKNIVWKTAIPHAGWSTPVVQNSQIWLTTATEDGHDFFVICIDAETGRIRFNKKVFRSDAPEPLGNPVNRYASPSPVIEPGRVYTHFGSYGTACLDTGSGEILWKRTDLRCRHYRGPGSSAIMHENLLILTFDGVDVQYVVALDKDTGRTVWKTDRTTEWNDLNEEGKPKREGDFRKAFSTPLVAQTSTGPQLLSSGSKAAYSYNPDTGEELWKVSLPGYSAVPRPVFGNGLAFMATGFGKTEILAVRVNGKGDVTNTHIAWRLGGKDAPRTPSPLLANGQLFVLADSGALLCLEPETGKQVWRERLGGNHLASPIFADGHIYCFSAKGKTTIFKPGPTYAAVATNVLDSGFMASPAIYGSSLVLRTETHLYRIENRETR